MNPISRISIVLSALAFAAGPCEAASFSVVHVFNWRDGAFPLGGVVMDGAGNLYGTTANAGHGNGSGTVYRVTPGGEFETFHQFTFKRPKQDGNEPEDSLVLGPQGIFFGTTFAGGIGSNKGAVFEIAPDGSESVIHSFFRRSRGYRPVAALAVDGMGRLFGTASGGAFGAGVVFEIRRNGQEHVLYPFKGGEDGADPRSGLIFDTAGNLYGTTAGGGGFSCGLGPDCGTVFKIAPGGQETVLYVFRGGSDGGVPQAGLVRDAAGNLYGTTTIGGGTGCSGTGCGTVFKIAPDGTETLLHAFNQTDGAGPQAGLTLDQAGNLYGATFSGGNLDCGHGAGCGTVFEIAPDGTETTLHVFAGTDGSSPRGTLLLDASGTLHGTTVAGGGGNSKHCMADGCGTIFVLTP